MENTTRPRSGLSFEDLQRIASQVKVKTYNGTQIRVVDSSGQRWIVFADICKALGYKNPNSESKRIAPNEKCKLEIGLKNTLAVGINRRGLFRFSFFTNRKNVAAFREWADGAIFNDGAG